MMRIVNLFVVCVVLMTSSVSFGSAKFWWQNHLTPENCSTEDGRKELVRFFSKDNEPSDLIELEEIPGLSLYWGPVHVVSEDDRNAIEDAAQLAYLTGRTIVVAGGYRTMKVQVGLACAEVLRANRLGRQPRIPSVYAVPGASNHGRVDRAAVDVQLGDEFGVPLWTGRWRDQWDAPKWYMRELASIMYNTGWYRYCAEIWHFERATRRNVIAGCFTYPNGEGCECQTREDPSTVIASLGQ
ncbi:MAG: hypothetical protein ABIH21_03345 [Patescibacteria group bacterium]